ncbi:MAG: hypothetical protein U0S49_02430 [Rhodospirillales bacterium]|nr:hypothetical protein [Rhodospirillales bacterium]
MWAKVSPPILPRLVHRERLHALLGGSFQGSVTWVGGPAGCGKTSLVASFVRRSERPYLWYKLDEGDNDPAYNFHWLSAAARMLTPAEADPELPTFSLEAVAGLSGFARSFMRKFDKSLPAGSVLVFDNVQDVDDEAFFYTLIHIGLQELTADKHVVLISRSNPHRLLATFSAARALTFVNWSDLRFADEEARALIALLTGEQDPAYADGLQAVADGWAVGLTLLSRCRRPPEGDEGAPVAGPRVPGVLFDYFAAEFVRSLDEGLRQFLLATAFAPMVTASTAQALSGRTDADSLLKDLHRRNWFIVRREGQRQTYEYHPLFRQFLREHAAASWPADDVTRLKRATAAALEHAGDIEGAMELFLDVRDWAAVERILARQGPAMAQQARHQTLGRWLQRVPAPVLEVRPWLRYWLGISRIAVSVPAALDLLAGCYEAFRKCEDSEACYLVWSTSVDLLCNLNCYSSQLDFWLDELEALQADQGEPVSDELRCRVAASMHAALSYRRPWHRDFPSWREKALQLSQKTGRRDLQSLIYMHWLQELTCNRSPEVDATMARMEELLQDGPGSSIDHLRIGFVRTARLMMEGHSQQAIDRAGECIGYADREGLVAFRPMLMYIQARAHLDLGQMQECASIISAYRVYCSSLGTMGNISYLTLKGIHELFCCEFKQAATTMGNAVEMLGGNSLTFAHFVICFVRAQALSEAKLHDAAAEDLRLLFEMAACMGTALQHHHCLLLEALLAENRGEREASLLSLGSALALAADAPLCHFVVWRPAALARLLALALANEIEPEAAVRIVRERKLAAPQPLQPLDCWPRRYRVQMLGPFSLTRDGVCIAGTQSTKLALLQSLIWHGGRNVSIDAVADDLWPDKDGDRAENTLQVTILRLRELIGDKAAISVANRAISLDPSLWWSDLEELRALVEAIHAEVGRDEAGIDNGRVLRLQDRLLRLKGEDLLVGSGDALWVRSARRKTKELFIRTLLRLQSFWERAGEPERADACRRRAARAAQARAD